MTINRSNEHLDVIGELIYGRKETAYFAYGGPTTHIETICRRCGDVNGGTEYACLTCGSEMVERREKSIRKPEEERRAFDAMVISITSFLYGKARVEINQPVETKCVDADEILVKNLKREGVEFDEVDWHDLKPTKSGYCLRRGLRRSRLLSE